MGWGVSPTPRPPPPPGKSRYPLYRRLGGAKGRSGRVENLVSTRIRSRTVQPVVSRYTDWAIGPIKPVDIEVLNTDDQEYERVNEFKYLGAILAEDKDATTEIKQRMITVNKSSHGFEKRLNSTNFKRQTKRTFLCLLDRASLW